MSNRRPVTLLITFAVTAGIGLVLAAIFDEQKGWNHPGQAIANVSWIVMLLSIVGLVVTGVTLLARNVRKGGISH